MASPFLAAGVALLFSVGWSIVNDHVKQALASEPTHSLSPPPRDLGWSQRLALLRPPAQTLMAWAFLVAFVIFFKMLEGPDHVRDMIARDEVIADGKITAVERAPVREMKQQLYELTFEFEYDGQLREGVSYTLDYEFDVDDPVAVIVDPLEPARARIEATRQRMTPAWILLFPGGVIVLLVLGIVASYLSRFRYWGLARHAEVAEAILVDAGRSDVANPLTRHEFDVDGVTYVVNPRSAIPADQSRCTVLYRSSAPQRNVGLSVRDESVLTRGAGFFKSAFGLLTPPLACIAGMIAILVL